MEPDTIVANPLKSACMADKRRNTRCLAFCQRKPRTFWTKVHIWKKIAAKPPGWPFRLDTLACATRPAGRSIQRFA